MALSNYERQKRWREKNRELYNLRRRNARNGDNVTLPPSVTTVTAKTLPPKFETKKVGELRMLVSETPSAKVETSPVRQAVPPYRNDFGGVISKYAWEKLQKMKEKAKKGNYELDEYSQ